MKTFAGLATARGFAEGPAFVYRGDGDLSVPEYIVAEGREGDEILRLRRARNETRRDLESLVAVLRERSGQEDAKVFECHQMMLDDPILQEEMESLIKSARINAEAAVRKVMDSAREKFERMNDPYFRERVRDIDDVERRLVKALTGFGGFPHLELKRPSVVVADDLTPSETVQLPRDLVLGFATNGGSATSHVALLARAMGIPAVTGLGDFTSHVTAGETVLLDGTSGSVTISPDETTLSEFRRLAMRHKEESTLAASVDRPAGMLKEGGDVVLCANVHPGVPFDGLRGLGARRIGLYRSEYLWLNREMEPDEDEQFEAYRAAALAAAALGEGSSVAIRLLDIGGDKLVRGISAHETNPFLGNRSIRYLLSNRGVLRTQLRAILRASAHGPVKMMCPMVSCVEELREIAVELEAAKRSLDADGASYDRGMETGAMIEVPSAALNAAALAGCVKFFSIGTNDLVQYTMAADRGNESVAHLYQPTNPAVLSLVRMTISAARARGIGVSVCGESAADPVVGTLWAAMGAESLSMSAAYIPLMARLLSMLSRSDLDEYAALAESLSADSTASEVMDACRRWMREHVPDFDEMTT